MVFCALVLFLAGLWLLLAPAVAQDSESGGRVISLAAGTGG